MDSAKTSPDLGEHEMNVTEPHEKSCEPNTDFLRRVIGHEMKKEHSQRDFLV